MKRILLNKSFAGVFIIVTSALIFCTQTDAAERASSKIDKKPETQKQKLRKLPTRRINWTAISPSNFRPDMTFNEAISILRNTTIPPLNIVVLWKNLEMVDIYRDTPIGIDGVTGVPLRTHLKLLLTSLSAGSEEKLGYIVDGGVIIISTEESLPKKMSTRIYDITDLTGTPASGGFMPGMGMFGMGMPGMGMPGMGMPMGLGGMPFGFGGMPFGGMMPFGLGGISGGMTPFGGTGYSGQGQPSYGISGSR